MALRIETVTVDALDPAALANFWSEALGWEQGSDDDGDIWVEPGPEQASAPLILFVAVGEHKAGKNRIHFDLVPDDQDTEVKRLEGLGASRASIGQTGNEDWVVMADPEGNEFCVLSNR